MPNKQSKIIMDLDAIMDFIFAPDEKRTSDVEIEEAFIPDENNPSSMLLAQKVKHETKNGEHEQHEAVRANFMLRLLDEIDDVDDEDLESLSLGEKIAYNTLFEYGFLKVKEQ